MIRLVIEAGPLAVFFFANARAGIMTGTAVFMAATVVALACSWFMERRLPVMPIVGCGFVVVFGGLTLWLQDDVFIKLKPTLVNLLFAATLFFAHVTRRNLLKHIMGQALVMDDQGWRTLGLRWACFFLVLAGTNEIVWRTLSTDAWVNFKVFAIMPATLLFAIAQVRLIMRHQLPESSETPESPEAA